MTTLAIYAALAKTMADVGHVGKEKKNAQQGYQFRGIDDVVAHVQQVMAANGVVCVPEVIEREREMIATKSGGTMASVRLLVRHTFFAHDGSSVVCTTLGEAMDAGDKASNKAMSAALKYALTETLLIPTYEVDRDTEESSPVMASMPPVPSQSSTRPPAPPSPPRKHAFVDAPPDADPIALEVVALTAALGRATSQGDLDALVSRIVALPAKEKAQMRAAWGKRRDALKVAP